MKLELIKPSASLNKAFRKTSLNRDQIELFKVNLKRLFDRLNEHESEEHLKNIVSDFLKDTWYRNLNEINTKGRADLVIHNGKSSSDTVGVIFEVKRSVNKAEMISEDKPNEKALHELLNYYLDERYINNNKEIKHLIITNIHEWYIFDGADFERFFFENQKLIKQYKDWHDGLFGVKLNDWFYQEIAKPFIEKELTRLKCTFFNLKIFETIIRNEDRSDDTKLIDLYKTLSPEHLLKKPFINDSNTLNKEFYTELLHIIGLEETKEGSKKLIKRKRTETRNDGSLLENTINILKIRNKLPAIENPKQFGETEEDQLFSVGLELCLTWLNRILFLKLLEGQLVRYQGNKEYAFLNCNRVKDFDELNELFFEVLAIPYGQRTSSVKEKFGNLPYLNSSLFEESELEQKTIVITELKGRLEIPIHSSTVFEDDRERRISGKKNTLQYLFEFLDAFDFASDNTAEIQEQKKTLINASVLGLIFEKINGYKDGSYFTPGYITMYMCHETIRRAVIQKFNEKYNWECADFADLYNKLEKVILKEANETINSLKICDPAVGSGHFLVSALNEIISIKNDLAILMDREGKRLKGYNVTIENDELILTQEDEIFSYNYKDKESQRIQETLFHEKQTIIENCLFGVDINPKSVMICRLRLWIELLKNAYYTSESNYRELETLPNIDINIKAGNSLISRFPLKDLYRTKYLENKTRDYRLFVNDYKNVKSAELKIGLRKLITGFKEELKKQLPDQTNPLRKDLARKTEEYVLKFQSADLFGQTMTDKEKKVKHKLEEEIQRLNDQIISIVNNPIYDNAFEWRFEFPEVLNDDGDYLGFDAVIGNPPYIRTMDIPENQKSFYWKEYESFEKKADIYCCFIELVIKILRSDKGFLSYIISNGWLRLDSFEGLRKLLLQKTTISQIIDFKDLIFEEAFVHTNILCLQNKHQIGNTIDVAIISSKTFLVKKSIDKKIQQEEFDKTYKNIFDLSIDSTSLQIKNKIRNGAKPLSTFFSLSFGLKTGDDGKFLSNQKFNENYKELLRGEDIHRYYYYFNGEYVNFVPDQMKVHRKTARPGTYERFEQPKILIRDTGQEFESMYDDENFYVKDVIIVTHNEKNTSLLKQLVAVLNSRLMKYFYESSFPTLHVQRDEVASLPIKLPHDGILFNQLVDQIITAKKSDTTADTSSLEQEIDNLVYELYGLTEVEIKIIEVDK